MYINLNVCMNTFIYRHAHKHLRLSSELVSAGGIRGKGWEEKAHPENSKGMTA